MKMNCPYVSCCGVLNVTYPGFYLFLNTFKFIVYFCDAVKETQGFHMLSNPFTSPSFDFSLS